MPTAGHVRRRVAEWQSKIEAQQEGVAQPARPRPAPVRLPSNLPDGRPCLCSCHDRDLFVLERAKSPPPAAELSPARGHIAQRAHGAAQAMLSRLPRPKPLRQPLTQSFSIAPHAAIASPQKPPRLG